MDSLNRCISPVWLSEGRSETPKSQNYEGNANVKITKKESNALMQQIKALSMLPNIWSTRSVQDEPQKWLRNWQIFKAVKASIQPDLFGYHFIGFDMHGFHGAVSSKIGAFDPVTMQGATLSGRVYQLVGMPGVNQDALYTLNEWSIRNEVVMQEATDEFIQHYKINMEQLSRME